MKDRFKKLSPREQLFVLSGTAALIIAVFYFYIWQPFANYVTELQQQSHYQQQTLDYMKAAEKKIQQLRQTQPQQQKISKDELLSVIDDSFKPEKLQQFNPQVSQINSTQARIEFKQVPFDYTMKWLQTLWQRYQIKTITAEIKPTKATGIVTAIITVGIRAQV